MSNETNAGVTASTEPVTLEEAIQLLGPDEVLLVGHSGWEGMQYSVVEESSVKFLTHTYGKWEDALTDRLDRKVAARDDAAELRAALEQLLYVAQQHFDQVRELHNSSLSVMSAEQRKAIQPPLDRANGQGRALAAVVAKARAALAASEGRGEP